MRWRKMGLVSAVVVPCPAHQVGAVPSSPLALRMFYLQDTLVDMYRKEQASLRSSKLRDSATGILAHDF